MGHQVGRTPLISSFFVIEDSGVIPQLCTERIGLMPTASGIKGERQPGSRWPVPISFWQIKLTKEPSRSIEDGLIKLIEILWPTRAKIRSFLDGTLFSAGFGSLVSIYEESPDYYLSAVTISALSSFGVIYGLDVYDYRDSVAVIPEVKPTGNPEIDMLPLVTTSLVIKGREIDAERIRSSLGASLAVPAELRYEIDASSRVHVMATQRRLDNIDLGISELLDLLWPDRERLMRALAEADATGTIMSSVWIRLQNPVYELSPESLRRLAELGMAFCLEICDAREEKIILKLEDLRPGWRKGDPSERRPPP
jgi:hypothetical protein